MSLFDKSERTASVLKKDQKKKSFLFFFFFFSFVVVHRFSSSVPYLLCLFSFKLLQIHNSTQMYIYKPNI